MNVRKWVAGGLVTAMLAGGSLVGATAASADPPGAPNNTGTGQTAASNSTGNSNNSGSNGSNSDNDHDNDSGNNNSGNNSGNNNSGNNNTAQQAADTYNGGENGEGEFGGTDSVANAAATPSDYDNDDPQPPAQPTPGPVPDDLMAGDVIDLFPPNLTPPQLVWPGGMGIGPIYQDNQGNLIGDVGLPNTEPINDPVNKPKSRSGGCDFDSGTPNLEDTRAMFPDRCGTAWHPELHKCDYSSSGWRCYSL